MVALRGQDVDAFIQQPKPSPSYVLLFGPDEGLVRERIDRLLITIGANTADPFSFCRLSSDTLRAEPDRLLEEASTLPLLGSGKIIVADMDGRTQATVLTRLLGLTPPQAWVIVSARDLKRDHTVRQAFERAPHAIAIACYSDTPRDIKTMISAEAGQLGYKIELDALDLLTTLLGADRAITRSEVNKLFLYCQGKQQITRLDVEDIIAEAQASSVDHIIDYACSGDTRAIVEYFSSSQIAKLSLSSLHVALTRWLLALHQMRLRVEAGGNIAKIIDEWRPTVHFSRKASVNRSLTIWDSARLLRAIEMAQAASLDSRRSPPLAAALTERSLIQIAQLSRQRR